MPFTDEEQKLIELSDADYKRIIKEFVSGQKFSLKFIRSLNLDDSRRTCLDYNEVLKRLEYYQNEVKSFESYIATVKTWY